MASPHELEVWIDSALISTNAIPVGHLIKDRSNVRFVYAKSWLVRKERFAIDPDLSLDRSAFHPDPSKGNFGIFLDSSPDRWGQTLMKRREAMEAQDHDRQPRTLHAWDFLIGVQDQTRQGALRFKYPGTDAFLDNHALAAPPVAKLAELEAIAKELSSKKIEDLNQLRQWLAVLVAPGASLGGARPKANFTQADGSLWIAKFPARDDVMDVAAWEMLAHRLAVGAGIEMPEAKLLRLSEEHRTFVTQRFDRMGGHRVHYASAMTMLKQSDSDQASYLDIAHAILVNGTNGLIKRDLAQLFRRAVFNALISNRDDHLRNHGFILTQAGWRLSPAFDLNPTIDKAEHVLSLDFNENRLGPECVMATAEYYDLSLDQAAGIQEEVLQAIRQWETIAKTLRIPRAEIELMRPAFTTQAKLA